MAADDPKFGISRFAGEFIDEVSFKEKVEVATRRNRVGVEKRVYPHNPTTDITIKGGGEPPLALGYVASPAITGLDGGGVFVVKERGHGQKNTDFDEFDISATHWPDGEIGSVAA